jgi:hypothetical protein
MLSKDPYTLIKHLPDPMEISFEDAERFIKKISSNIYRVAVGQVKQEHASRNGFMDKEGSKIITVKVFHYNEALLAEYKIVPEIKINHDGTINHIIRSLFIHGGMPQEIVVYVEEKNSGLHCANLKVLGINETIWGPEEEIKEIVEAIELIEETKQAILGRLKLDGINVY